MDTINVEALRQVATSNRFPNESDEDLAKRADQIVREAMDTGNIWATAYKNYNPDARTIEVFTLSL